MSSIVLHPSVRNAIARHLVSCYPLEGCGALLGKRRSAEAIEVDEARGLPNCATDRQADRFIIDPLAYEALERSLARGHFVAGFFHSHPDGESRPSVVDLEMAQGLYDAVAEFYIYAIQCIAANGAGELTFWRLNTERTAFEALPVDG